MSLARRTLTSVSYNVTANIVFSAVSLARSIILARILPVETFGLYAQASAWVRLSVVLASFGMGAALIHRAAETEDEDFAASVFFTLKVVFTSFWAFVMIVAASVLTAGEMRLSLVFLTIVVGISEIANAPRFIYIRRVQHRRLAILQVTYAVLSTVISLYLAWNGATIWALLSTDLISLILTILVLYAWHPIWLPRLAWSKRIVRYFLSFGYRSFFAEALLQTLNRIDDIWTGLYLGNTALGFYSRAYTFATYPRQLLAAPINQVAGGTYAELKNEAHKLSQAFFRTNALMARAGFLLGGILALIAPEFIRISLGEKWMPMLPVFRLMLLFTLLDPIKITISNLFMALGSPETVVKVRLVQLVILMVTMFALGLTLGTTGVAVAVDIMLLVGIGMLLVKARNHIRFSTQKMFLPPFISLCLGMLVVYGLWYFFPALWGSDWLNAILKGFLFTLCYGLAMFVWERKELLEMLMLLRSTLAGKMLK